MEEIDLFPRKNGRRNTEELILSILQKTRNELKIMKLFHSKTIDFRLKSITIDGASVNARLTDIIAEYET